MRPIAGDAEIEFVSGGAELLERVRPLWAELRRHVGGRSRHFSQEMASMTWEERRSEILDKAAGGGVRIDLAIEAGTSRAVGYCVSSLTREGEGEIDSIFVVADQRGRGIGDQLMRRAMAWLDASGARSETLEVTWGNDEVMGFYAQRGFLPRRVILERKLP